MAFFYILKCNDTKYYYGSTRNLKRRLVEHKTRQNKSTKHRLPVRLVYYREFDTYKMAFNYEKKFKNGKTRKSTIEKAIKNFPADRLTSFV